MGCVSVSVVRQIKRFPSIDGDVGWYKISPTRTRRLGTRLTGIESFDVAVIGAGYTGLSFAHRFAEINPKASVAVIDALQVGQGTAGRNAGFIIDLPHVVDSAASYSGANQRIYQLNTFAIERLQDFQQDFDIDCDWHRAGKYLAAHESRNLRGLDEFVTMLKRSGFDYERLEGNALSERLGSAYYRAAVYTPGNILMNPSSLIRGIAANLPNSVTLFEESPVISCEYGSPHSLNCVGGTLKARAVVVATNSYNAEFGYFSYRLVPISTYASLTEPIPASDYAANFADVQPYGLTSAHHAGSTVRLTPDRRILVRNTFAFEPTLRSTEGNLRVASRQHRRSFEARFPELRNVKFEFTWGGLLCMTRNQEPVFKRITDTVYSVGACNGVGVAKGTYLGYYMADYISGIDSENLGFILSHSNPTWIPPDPIRSVSARVRLRREAKSAGGEV